MRHPPDGAVAQLGERIVRNDEVRGSIPLSSTSGGNQLKKLTFFGCWPVFLATRHGAAATLAVTRAKVSAMFLDETNFEPTKITVCSKTVLKDVANHGNAMRARLDVVAESRRRRRPLGARG